MTINAYYSAVEVEGELTSAWLVYNARGHLIARGFRRGEAYALPEAQYHALISCLETLADLPTGDENMLVIGPEAVFEQIANEQTPDTEFLVELYQAVCARLAHLREYVTVGLMKIDELENQASRLIERWPHVW